MRTVGRLKFGFISREGWFQTAVIVNLTPFGIWQRRAFQDAYFDFIPCYWCHLLQWDLSAIALGDPGVEKPSVPGANKTQPEVCLRLEVGPNAAVHSPLAVENGFLHMLVHSYTAEFFMSFLTNLGPFLEDEIIPEVIPMEIEVVDTKITLKVSVWGTRDCPQDGCLGRAHSQDSAWERMLWNCYGLL